VSRIGVSFNGSRVFAVDDSLNAGALIKSFSGTVIDSWNYKLMFRGNSTLPVLFSPDGA
jgi:hypothetical protein